jgi:hypothetical protein
LTQATPGSESRDTIEKDGEGNQDSEEENHEDEEDQTGNSWGHSKFPGDVYGSSPFLKSDRNKQDVVWDDVKFMKKHTAKVLQSTRSIHMSVWRVRLYIVERGHSRHSLGVSDIEGLGFLGSEGWILGMGCLQLDFVGIGTRLRSVFWVSWFSLTWSNVQFTRIFYLFIMNQ